MVYAISEGVLGSNDVSAGVKSDELCIVVIVVLMSNQNKVGRGLVTKPTKRVNENHFSAVGCKPKRGMSLIKKFWHY